MRTMVNNKVLFVLMLVISMLSPVLSGMTQAQVADPAQAQAVAAQPIIPLEVEPVCSDAATGTAKWKVTNKNTQTVNIHWTNLFNNVSGDFGAVNGVSTMITSYVASDPNNTTRFESGTDVNQTNATKAACNPVVTPQPPVDCIDGSVYGNVIATYLANNKVQLTTAGGKQLCNDVTVFFSSYIMPDNYNGLPFFGNTTAYPQDKFASVSAVLPANSPINQTLEVALPDSCRNVQVDVYYGPEIVTVGPNGHGTQNILSQVYPKTGVCGQPGQGSGGNNGGGTTNPGGNGGNNNGGNTAQPTGGMGSSVVTTAVATTPATVTPVAQPTTLPETGGMYAPILAIIPAAVMALSYFGALSFQKRRAYGFVNNNSLLG